MKKPKKKKKGSHKKSRSKTKPKDTAAVQIKPPIEEKDAKTKSYQPVPKRELEKKDVEKGGLLKYVNIAGQFLRESRGELKKVKWPTRKELLASTAMVIFLVIVVAFFLGLIDFGLIKIIKNIVG